MDKKCILFYLSLLMFHVSCYNIHEKRHFCGNLVHETLTRYNCQYVVLSDNTPNKYNYNGGIVDNCCEKSCTTLEFVNMYCESSDLDNQTSTDRTNEIVPETYKTQELPNNIKMKSNKTDNAMKKRKVSNKKSSITKNKHNIARKDELTKRTKRYRKTKSSNKHCPCTCQKRSVSKIIKDYKPPVVDIKNTTLNDIIWRPKSTL